MMLSQYEQHLAAAGIATLAFDYRHTGASAGMPRQRISMRRHRADVHAALDYLRARDDIDASRIGLWGTSLGAMHTLCVAADRHDLAAVVVQCPIVSGPAAAIRSGPLAVARLSPAVLADAARFLLGRERRYVCGWPVARRLAPTPCAFGAPFVHFLNPANQPVNFLTAW